MQFVEVACGGDRVDAENVSSLISARITSEEGATVRTVTEIQGCTELVQDRLSGW